MTAQHTPGPWHVGDVGDGDHLWVGLSANATVAICDKFKPRSNAVLMAAAPDLLALALQYRDDLKRPPSADSIERRLAAVNAVIAKATA